MGLALRTGMIAISSIRPLSEDKEYRENQLRAYYSWIPVFSKVIYYAKEVEPDLNGPHVEFMRILEDFPAISSMAWMAALQDDLTAIINGDIVVSTLLHTIPEKMRSEHVWAVTSRRYNFNTKMKDMEAAVVDDKGADFFMCQPNIWRLVTRAVPQNLRIGQQQWDHWMVGFLATTLGKQFRNITESRCIFHPRHEGRKRIDIGPVDDPYLRQARWPMNL